MQKFVAMCEKNQLCRHKPDAELFVSPLLKRSLILFTLTSTLYLVQSIITSFGKEEKKQKTAQAIETKKL